MVCMFPKDWPRGTDLGAMEGEEKFVRQEMKDI